MRIASWNVNSIKARLSAVTDWLAATRPDVLMIQELKGEIFPESEFTALGYRSAAVGQKAYNGVATLSLHPIKTILDRLPGDDTDEQARYLETDINGLRLINIYAPNGNPVDTEKFPYKLRWLERLKTRLAELRRDNVPIAVGGDFNVIPEARDCFDPTLWKDDALFRIESRAAFRSLIHLGFTDAFRTVNNENQQYTFWDYQAGCWPKNHGIRIDHFLLAPSVTDRLVTCTIDKTPRGLEKSSDHTPIIMEVAI